MNAERPTRRQLLRWLGWFGVLNTALFALVLSRYLFYYPFSADLPGNLYVLLAFIGQAAVLACIPMFAVTVPFALLVPIRGFVTGLAVLLASFGLSILYLDANLFGENRFHLSFLMIAIFERTTWVFTGVFWLILLAFESLLASIVWRGFAGWSRVVHGAWIGVTLSFCWLAGQALHIWGDAVAHTPVTQFTRFMPLYYPIHAKRDLARLGLVDPEQVRKRRLLRGSFDAGGGQLQYPLRPMDCRPGNDGLPNILIILIDALRPDTVHPGLMPNLYAFSENAVRFNRHYSGGNSSRMGLFSMFYGLPSTYWQSFYDLQRSPVLMDQVRDKGLQVALFSAVGFGSPTLIDRTAFAGWPDLPEERSDIGKSAQNAALTDDWLNWLTVRDVGRPFFGFLYFDPPMWEYEADGREPLPMDDRFTDNSKASGQWRQYRLAMRSVDVEVGRVLNSLRSRSLLDDTIVLITSDHGYEFDDNGLGYIGHASSFSTPQLHVVLIGHWPGIEARDIDYRTSHHDLPVTLLQDVFGCRNPPREYGIGRNLFSGESWAWTMAGSYTAHAIVKPDQVIVSHPGGFVEILDERYRPVSGASLDVALVQEAMEAQRRFFK